MDPKKTYYETLSNTLIKNFSKRGIEAYYAKDSDEAVEIASRFLTPGCTIGHGGSMTLNDIGLLDSLRNSDYTLYDRAECKTFEDFRELQAKVILADFYFMSTNAISLDGHLVNIDMAGNRVSALMYGPANVIIIAGMNKVCPDLESAIKRARNIAAPPNNVRLGMPNPCVNTGRCMECYGPQCLCSNIVITRKSFPEGRIKIVLVGEELGY